MPVLERSDIPGGSGGQLCTRQYAVDLGFPAASATPNTSATSNNNVLITNYGKIVKYYFSNVGASIQNTSIYQVTMYVYYNTYSTGNILFQCSFFPSSNTASGNCITQYNNLSNITSSYKCKLQITVVCQNTQTQQNYDATKTLDCPNFYDQAGFLNYLTSIRCAMTGSIIGGNITASNINPQWNGTN